VALDHEAGVRPGALVLGLALMGRSFELVALELDDVTETPSTGWRC
jgi:hypothetical protein